mgnify:CR=1 FL=1
MDNLTKIVRTEISRQYKSVRQFALTVGIPLSTINSALHNGIGGSSFDTVVQICKVLGIKALSDDSAFYLTDDTQELLTQYAQLDSYGRHTVATVLKVEAERCRDAADTFSGQLHQREYAHQECGGRCGCTAGAQGQRQPGKQGITERDPSYDGRAAGGSRLFSTIPP